MDKDSRLLRLSQASGSIWKVLVFIKTNALYQDNFSKAAFGIVGMDIFANVMLETFSWICGKFFWV